MRHAFMVGSQRRPGMPFTSATAFRVYGKRMMISSPARVALSPRIEGWPRSWPAWRWDRDRNRDRDRLGKGSPARVGFHGSKDAQRRGALPWLCGTTVGWYFPSPAPSLRAGTDPDIRALRSIPNGSPATPSAGGFAPVTWTGSPDGATHSHTTPDRMRRASSSSAGASWWLAPGSRPAWASASRWKARHQRVTSGRSSSVASRSRPGAGAGARRSPSSKSRVCISTSTDPPPSRASSSATSRVAGSAPLTPRTSSPRACSSRARARAASSGIGSR